MTETNELHFSNLNGNSLWQNKFYITLWAVQVDAQVDSDTAACLETALMSPGNQRSWTPSQLVRLHFNPNSPFKKKAFSGKEQRTTFLLSNAFHISNRNKLVRLVLLCWSVRRSRSSPRIQPDQLRADVCMSQRNRNSFAYLLERRWRSRAFKGTQRGTTKTSNGSGSHTWVGETKRGNDVLNEPQGQGHQTEALPHSKPVHGWHWTQEGNTATAEEAIPGSARGKRRWLPSPTLWLPTSAFHRPIPVGSQLGDPGKCSPQGPAPPTPAAKEEAFPLPQRKASEGEPAQDAGGQYPHPQLWKITSLSSLSLWCQRPTQRVKCCITISSSTRYITLSRWLFVLLPFKHCEENFFCCSQYQNCTSLR